MNNVIGRKLFCAAVLLCATAAVMAAPTAGTSEPVLVARSFSTLTETGLSAAPLSQSTYELFGIGTKLLNSAVGFTNPPASISTHPKSLPAVPATFLLVLTGFLCVTLVKDRRVWVAAFAGLLYLGQAGITSVPHLLGRDHCKTKKHFEQLCSVKINYTFELDNSFRPRSEIDGSQYIGLLHHLAGIPARVDSQHYYHTKYHNISVQTEEKFSLSQFALTKILPHTICANNCSYPVIEQFVVFSPAFIFDNLSRGPPALS